MAKKQILKLTEHTLREMVKEYGQENEMYK